MSSHYCTIKQLKTKNLEVVLCESTSHHKEIYSRTIPLTIAQAITQGVDMRYKVGIIEGNNYGGEDAKFVLRYVSCERVVDLFFDPLSVAALDEFQKHCQHESNGVVSARFAAAWLHYAMADNYDVKAMESKIVKVLREKYGDDFPIIQLAKDITLQKEALGKSFETKCRFWLEQIIRLANDRTAVRITAELKDLEGRVFVYCGDRHSEAVEEAFSRVSQAQSL